MRNHNIGDGRMKIGSGDTPYIICSILQSSFPSIKSSILTKKILISTMEAIPAPMEAILAPMQAIPGHILNFQAKSMYFCSFYQL